MSLNLNSFRLTVDNFYNEIASVSEKFATLRKQPDQWTLKEMLGHLIDSASNNHQRFIRLQLEKTLTFPKYEAEAWVKIETVNNIPWNELVELWKLYNEFLLHLVNNVNQDCLQNNWSIDGQEKSLEFIITDYYRHIDWHKTLFVERVNELIQR